MAEAVVAVAAGLAADSIALVGFGADSVIEGAAGFVVLWLAARGFSAAAVREGRASWRGDACCSAPIPAGPACPEDCCA